MSEMKQWIPAKSLSFKVVEDLMTHQEPDIHSIAANEDWAAHLCEIDMEGFSMNEDGNLLLMDELGNYAYCPANRFRIEVHVESMVNKFEYLFSYVY